MSSAFLFDLGIFLIILFHFRTGMRIIMILSERIECVLCERNITQKTFADTLGISANYVNQLVKGKKTNVSEPLAKLIEETYGYSAKWIMLGEGEKFSKLHISPIKAELLKEIPKMSEDEAVALLAFSNSLDNVKKSFGIE